MGLKRADLTYCSCLGLQHYSAIMPLLLNVMQNANGPEYRKLRVKAMECAGLIGKAPMLCLLHVR